VANDKQIVRKFKQLLKEVEKADHVEELYDAILIATARNITRRRTKELLLGKGPEYHKLPGYMVSRFEWCCKQAWEDAVIQQNLIEYATPIMFELRCIADANQHISIADAAAKINLCPDEASELVDVIGPYFGIGTIPNSDDQPDNLH